MAATTRHDGDSIGWRSCVFSRIVAIQHGQTSNNLLEQAYELGGRCEEAGPGQCRRATQHAQGSGAACCWAAGEVGGDRSGSVEACDSSGDGSDAWRWRVGERDRGGGAEAGQGADGRYRAESGRHEYAVDGADREEGVGDGSECASEESDGGGECVAGRSIKSSANKIPGSDSNTPCAQSRHCTAGGGDGQVPDVAGQRVDEVNHERFAFDEP